MFFAIREVDSDDRAVFSGTKEGRRLIATQSLP
jgi:hypothetical protein